MKTIVRVLVVLILGMLGTADAADFATSRAGALGLGIALGQPLGATGKFWFSNLAAVDGFVGYHIDGNADFHSDVVVHAYPFKSIPRGELPIYIGLGGRVLAGDDTQFGLRIPLGVSYLYSPGRFEIFTEVAPVIRLNDVKGSIDGLVGLRLYMF